LFPRDYAAGLAVALAATWLAVAATVVARHLIARGR
jgi:hypothetical protein